MNKVAATNIPGLVKDTVTNVIHNTNLGEYKLLLAARKKQKDENQMKRELRLLKQEVEELRLMVEDLFRRLD